jgi:hypothetical protein
LKARDGSTENVIRSRVASILDLLVLCRKPGATITGLDNTVIRAGEDLPRHDIVMHDLEFIKEEYDFYQAREGVCGKEVNFDFADIAAKEQHLTEEFLAKKPDSRYQQVICLTTHMGMFGLRKTKTDEMRRWKEEGLPVLFHRMKSSGGLPDRLEKAEPTPVEEILRQFLRGSPKFRWMSSQLNRILNRDAKIGHNKALVMFQWPRSAFAALKLLGFLGIKCALLTLEMPLEERNNILQAFDESPGAEVLLCTYTLKIDGIDLQHQCSDVLSVEKAFSQAVEMQAGHRVHRIGAEYTTRFLRAHLIETYDEVLEISQLRKFAFLLVGFGALSRHDRSSTPR